MWEAPPVADHCRSSLKLANSLYSQTKYWKSLVNVTYCIYKFTGLVIGHFPPENTFSGEKKKEMSNKSAAVSIYLCRPFARILTAQKTAPSVLLREMISCAEATMPLVSISMVALNLDQSAGTPLVIYNIRLTGLLMTRTKPQCGRPTAVAVVTWHLPGDWRCHAGCHHSLAQEEGVGGVRVCGCVHWGGHLVVVAAGSEKTRGWGGGQGQGAPSFIKTPLCEPHVRPHPGCKVKTGLPRCTHTCTFINTHVQYRRKYEVRIRQGDWQKNSALALHVLLACHFFGGVSVFAWVCACVCFFFFPTDECEWFKATAVCSFVLLSHCSLADETERGVTSPDRLLALRRQGNVIKLPWLNHVTAIYLPMYCMKRH